MGKPKSFNQPVYMCQQKSGKYRKFSTKHIVNCIKSLKIDDTQPKIVLKVKNRAKSP